MFIIIRMDISGNFDEIMLQYNKNISDYNDNIRLYLNIVANNQRQQAFNMNQRRDHTEYMYRTVPITQSIFSPLLRNRQNVLQDVVVRPSQQQIVTATELVIFDENIQNNNTNCPITLEPFLHGEEIYRIRHCSHLFKKNALYDWFRRNVRCPVCRYDIRDYVAQEQDQESPENQDDNASEYDEIVDELLNETIGHRQPLPILSVTRERQPSIQSNFTRNLTSAIRSFVNNELSNLPTDLNSVASELLYTFDIPISFDISGNVRI